MSKLIIMFLEAKFIFRVASALITIAAIVYILRKYLPIRAKYRVIEPSTELPPAKPAQTEKPAEPKEPPNLLPCPCGGTPEFKEGYDPLLVKCPSCGRSTDVIVGDYYDEAFMLATYRDAAVRSWNYLVQEGR